MRRLSGFLVLLAATLCACTKKPPPAPARQTRTIVVTTSEPRAVRLQSLSWQPAVKAIRVERGPRRVELELPADGAKQVELKADGACSQTVDLEDPTVKRVKLGAFFRVRLENMAQLGYDAPFSFKVEPGCEAAKTGPVVWHVVQGANLNLSISQNGRMVRGRTPSLESLHGRPIAAGILPASPRTSARTVLSATWESGERKVEQIFTLASQTRATGLPSVARGHRVWLTGAWTVSERPKGSQVDAVSHGDNSSLLPDALGRFVLSGPAKQSLELTVGAHGDGPLDCGRAECHRRISVHAGKSPMTTIFQRGVTGKLGSYNSSCVSGCHTTGEIGVDDGGYDSVLRDFGWNPSLPTGPEAFDHLPRDARRVSGVTCTACHGPGAIPAPSAAWSVLRTAVCATCHDFPPEYEHVVRYEKTRMAQSQRRKGIDAEPCNGCHTTAGFLVRIGASSKPRQAPQELSHGLSCQTCHAAHAPRSAAKLLRLPDYPKGFPKPDKAPTTARVCIACHASQSGGPGQASLMFARAPGIKPPHAELVCTDCHGARDERPRGASHDFAVRVSVCSRCHEPPVMEQRPPEGSIAERAKALWEKRVRRPLPTAALPAHASELPEVARWLGLILDDHGAAAHNAPYARAMLDALEQDRPWPPETSPP